jgi:hypothetical protein
MFLSVCGCKKADAKTTAKYIETDQANFIHNENFKTKLKGWPRDCNSRLDGQFNVVARPDSDFLAYRVSAPSDRVGQKTHS